MISFGLAAAVTLMLFSAFGSMGLAGRATVETSIASMHAVMPDGATFLVYGARETAGPAPITLIRNWAAGLTPFAAPPAREPRRVAIH